MKRLIASLATLVVVASFLPVTASAASVVNNDHFTRKLYANPRLRPNGESGTRAAHIAYRLRHNRNFVRSQYNNQVLAGSPYLLTQAGGGSNLVSYRENESPARPSKRELRTMTLADHCNHETNNRVLRRCSTYNSN